MLLDYVEKIMSSPDAPLQVDALNEAMRLEKEKRQDFYNWVTPGIKAEFINGEVILHSPVKKQHFSITELLSRLLSYYCSIIKQGRVAIEKAMISLTRNDYEPDLVFFNKDKYDSFKEDQMLFPAPDFVVEILSKSTASVDKGIKKQDNALHGIPEYWIIDPLKQSIQQYILLSPKDKVYTPPKVFGYGTGIESHAIKGFSIPVAAIFDEEINVATLESLMKG